jgi:streptogramin lyase
MIYLPARVFNARSSARDRRSLVPAGGGRAAFVVAILPLFGAQQTFAEDRPLAAGRITVVDTKEAAGLKQRVDFQEWATPAKREHPHAPLATSDGGIGYTGQGANSLVRFDPGGGKIARVTISRAPLGY